MSISYRVLPSVVALAASLTPSVVPAAADETLVFRARSRVETAAGSGEYRPVQKEIRWEAAKTAVVVCDMWRFHWCKNATRRAAEFAPRANELVCALRERGVLIIHCPSPPPGEKDHYKDLPQRKLAQQAPAVPVVDPPWEPPPGWKKTFGSGWRAANILREAPMPLDVSDNGCDCTPQCKNWAGKMDTRQIEAIPFAAQDAVAGDNLEAFFLMKQRGI